VKNDYSFEIPDPDLPVYYDFYWAPTTINGRLLSSRPMLKQSSGEKILSRQNGAENGGFLGK